MQVEVQSNQEERDPDESVILLMYYLQLPVPEKQGQLDGHAPERQEVVELQEELYERG